MKKSAVIGRLLLAIIVGGICFVIYRGISDNHEKQKQEIEQAIKRNNDFLEGTKYLSKPTSYEEAFRILNHKYTNEDFAALMRMKLIHEQSNNTPFESTELYLNWDSYYKTSFHQ